ncbi:hypothetical protein D3C75_1140560 [compost metagenome]
MIRRTRINLRILYRKIKISIQIWWIWFSTLRLMLRNCKQPVNKSLRMHALLCRTPPRLTKSLDSFEKFPNKRIYSDLMLRLKQHAWVKQALDLALLLLKCASCPWMPNKQRQILMPA